MLLPVIRAQKVAQRDVNPLSINADQVAQWLIAFLKAEVVKRRRHEPSGFGSVGRG
jgi:hypothetical protein